MSESSTEIYSKLGTLSQSLDGILRRLDQIQDELHSARSEVSSNSAQIQWILGVAEQEPHLQGNSGDKIVSDANEAIQKLSLGRSQEEILDLFLQEVEQYVDRAVLFLSKGDQYSPWKSLGFEASQIGSIVAEGEEDSIVKSARRQRIIYRSESVADAFPWLSRAGEIPKSTICIPLVFNDYVPVVLYGDSSGSIALDALELLTHLTVLVLKNNYLQGVVSSRPAEQESRSRKESGEVAGAAAIEPEVPLKTEEEPPSAEAAGTGDTPPGETSAAPAEPAPPREEGEVQQLESGVVEGQTFEETREQAISEEAAWEPIPSVEMPEEALQQKIAEETPSLQTAPELEKPEELEPEVTERPEEEQRLHNDARRFARLLVSEIKLYNENQVQQGRLSADLYFRLSQDVDRSREMYQKRAHPSVQTSTDYFHEELVRIVAGGDENLLGEGYPGPRLSAE